MTRKRWLGAVHASAALAAALVLVAGVQAASTLDIYFIDVADSRRSW